MICEIEFVKWAVKLGKGVNELSLYLYSISIYIHIYVYIYM